MQMNHVLTEYDHEDPGGPPLSLSQVRAA